MRETRGDTTRAVVLAVGLHALIAVMLLVGLWWQRTPDDAAAGSPMSAELVDADSLSTSAQRALRAEPQPMSEPVVDPLPEPLDDAMPIEQPIPEPMPEDAAVPEQSTPQDFVPEPDDTDREEVIEAPTARASDEETPQTAKSRQSQVDLTRAERQEQAEQQRRLSAVQLERDRQIAEIRRQRTEAAREAQVAEQRLKQIADERARQASSESAAGAAAPPGNNGVDRGLLSAYQAALTQAITAKWTRPESIPAGARCRITIRQLPGGEVVDAQVGTPCSYDEQGRRSIEAAVLKAQPLPYAGFESVFNRTLTITFTAQD